MALISSAGPQKRGSGCFKPLGALSFGGSPLISFGFVLAIWSVVALLKIVPETVFPWPWHQKAD